MTLDEVVSTRRSVRRFKDSGLTADEKKAKISSVIQFVSDNAPSWKNSQTHRYYAALSPEKLALVQNALSERNRSKCENAVALIVSCFEKNTSGFSKVDEKPVPDNECGNEWGAYDLGLSDSLLLLAARANGLDTLIMGLRDSSEIRKILGIPDSQEVMSVISVGVRESEPVKPPRKELSEILFTF